MKKILSIIAVLWVIVFPFVMEAGAFRHSRPTPTTEYNPPIPEPELDFDLASVRQMVDAGMPVLIQFKWSHGMEVLDDYGYLNVELEDVVESHDFVRVACIAYYRDEDSGENVFNCGPFYGRWTGENSTTVVSFDEGYIRSFMITDSSMDLLFQHGAYAIR